MGRAEGYTGPKKLLNHKPNLSPSWLQNVEKWLVQLICHVCISKIASVWLPAFIFHYKYFYIQAEPGFRLSTTETKPGPLINGPEFKKSKSSMSTKPKPSPNWDGPRSLSTHKHRRDGMTPMMMMRCSIGILI